MYSVYYQFFTPDTNYTHTIEYEIYRTFRDSSVLQKIIRIITRKISLELQNLFELTRHFCTIHEYIAYKLFFSL